MTGVFLLVPRYHRCAPLSHPSRQSLHSPRHGEQCCKEQTDDNTSDIKEEIKVNGQKLQTVTSFKYLGSVVFDEGSKLDILSRIAQMTAVLIRLKPV